MLAGNTGSVRPSLTSPPSPHWLALQGTQACRPQTNEAAHPHLAAASQALCWWTCKERGRARALPSRKGAHSEKAPQTLPRGFASSEFGLFQYSISVFVAVGKQL